MPETFYFRGCYGLTIKTPFLLKEMGFCVLLDARNIDSIFQILNSGTMAPIKRLVSTKNTYPSQKRIRFFAQTKFRSELAPLPLPAPGFSNIYSMHFFIDLLTGTHRDQGKWKIQIHRPWSISEPQKNIGTLSCPKGYNKILGSLRPTIAGAWQRQIKKKNFRRIWY